MKNKSLITRIMASALSILVCFTGFVGLCLLVDNPDLSTFVLIGLGMVIVGLVSNVAIWSWGGPEKGE